MLDFRCALGLLLFTLAAHAGSSATVLGGVLGVTPAVVAHDAAGNLLVAGTTYSFQLPVTDGSRNLATNFTISTDHGQTWRSLNNPPSGYAFTFDIGPATWPAIFAVTSDSIYKSLDGGSHWAAVTPVLGANSVVVDPVRPQVAYIGAYTGIYKTTDGGGTWTNIGAAIATPWLPPLYITIDPRHPDTIYTWAVTPYRSFDGGKTWSTYTLPGVGNDGTSAGAPVFDPQHPGVIYVTGGRGLFRSADDGQTWTQLNTPFIYGGPITLSPIAIWVRDLQGNVYRSIDQGATFTLLPDAPRGEFHFAVDPANPAIVLTDSYRTTDNGATWQPLPIGRVGVIRFDPSAAGKALSAASPGASGFLARLDPSGEKIQFATYFGDVKGAAITRLVTDPAGNIYAAGSAWSDIFAAKFDSSGKLLFATHLPASPLMSTRAIAVDSSGGLRIAAQSYVAGAAADCVLTLLAPDGALAQSAAIAPMDCAAVAIDPAGTGVAVGATTDPAFPVTPDALQRTLTGARNAVLVRFDRAGKVTYATYLGGSSNDAATAVTIDGESSVYVTGTTKSKDFPTTSGAWQTAFTADCPYPTDYLQTNKFVITSIFDNQNSFVTKIDASGALVYSTYFGGNCKDTTIAIAVDSTGNAWITGSSDSSTFPLVWPVDTPGRDPYSGFVTRFAASGAWLWRSSFLSTLPSPQIAVDAEGNAYFGVANGVLKVPGQP